jgi:hypothetical protein
LLVLASRQGAGDAASVAPPRRSLGRAEAILGDDVGQAEPAAGAQDAGDLGEHAGLLRREVDDAVRDDHVHARRRQRDGLHLPLQDLDVGRAGLAHVAAGQRHHLWRHVQAVDTPRGPDAAGGEEDVDTAAAAQVEHHLPGT